MKIFVKVFLMVWVMTAAQAAAAYTCTAVSGNKNWDDKSTWTGCNDKVPQNGDTVIIPNGSTVTLDKDSKEIAYLTIATGGTLKGTDGKDLKLKGPGNLTNNGTLSLGSGDIKLEGNFVNAGTFTAGTGEVEFNGNAAQTITGNVTFYDLKVDNGSSNGLTLAGNVVVAKEPSGNAETGGLVKLTSTCPTDYTLTSDGGANLQHSCAGGGATAPTATTNAATSVTATGATLNGTVSSNGASTTVTFDYGLTTGYGSSATASASPLASGASGSAVSAAITGLTCGGTTYHFQVKAVNSAGTTNGGDRTFTTAVCSVPAVTSINRADFNPAKAGTSVSWTVVFNTSVTGVDAADFALVQAGGASITTVSGSGTTWTVTVSTSTATAGTLGLNLVDNDSINSGGVVLAGVGVNGNFTGQTYTVIASPCSSPLASDILFCDDFERANAGSVGNGWTVIPNNVSSCTGASGNTGCSGIDSDIAPFSTYTNARANPSRAMFTRWATVSVDSPVVNLAGRTGAQLSFWMRRGRDTFSECPEAAGENYLVQYYASDLTWKILAQYPSSPSAALCDGQIFTPVIELPPDALHAAFKMRFYQPSGSGRSGSGGAPGVVGYDYWHMDDVVIRATTGPSYVGAFCDNFEAGSKRWSITAEGFTSGSIGDASIGTKAFQSSSHALDLRWGYVTASTFKTNLTGVGGNITYWVRSGTTTALDPVTNENLVVEYLNSAGAWTTLNTYLGSVASGTAYSASYAIPADAKHANFRLRFRKVSGSGYDKSYWHVDDVCVGDPRTADLSLTMTGDSTLVPGNTTSYTLKVTNTGPDTFSGSLQIIDTLPNGLSYVAGGGGTSGWTCVAPSQTITCNWSGTLLNGALAPDLVITATVGAGVVGNLTNTAVLTGGGTDPNTGNNTASFSSGNFVSSYVFTDKPCVDGIAFGQSGQCNLYWQPLSSFVAGAANAGIYITAVTKINNVDVPTKLSSSASTAVGFQFGLSCLNPDANAGVRATFTAATAALPLCTSGNIEPTGWSAAATLTFASGAASVATPYTFTYADVGQVELYMRNSVATSQVGKSTPFVVKPAGLVLNEIKPTDTTVSGRCALPTTACANTAADAMTFVRAGEAFTTTVKAVTTSGGAAPNFGKETTPASVALIPENVVAAMISPPGIEGVFGTFSGGIGTGVDFKWGEVGIITLTPQVADYLGAGVVTGTTSGNVGRFYPDHFAVLASPNFAPGCSAGGFSYMDQPFALAATLEARNLADEKTQNYSGSFATGVVGIQVVNTNIANSVRVSIATTRLGGLGTPSWDAGSYPFVATQLNKLTTGPDGPYDNLDFGLSVSDETSMVAIGRPYLQVRDMDESNASCTVDSTARVTTSTVCKATKIVSAAKMRYGRARMDNAYGSESLDLPVVFQTEYYDGGWKRNTLDTCTGATIAISYTVAPDVTASTCVLEASNNSGRGCAAALTGAKANRGYLETNVTGTDSNGVAGFAGNFNLWLKATGAGSRGSVNVTATVPEWLRFNWKGNGVVDPSATATFGVYKSPIIYRRENY